MEPLHYRAPWWLPEGHSQTIWSALWADAAGAAPRPLRRERWTTPDGDFVDVDLQPASDPKRPMLVMFHGLEGSSASHYARAFADWAALHDLHWVMPHFRGCSGEINRGPRAYHSGDHEEIDWILRRLRQGHRAQGGCEMLAVGVSLGGNALMRWAGEWGEQAHAQVDAVAAICSPLDLAASGQAIGRGFNRLVYTRMFLRTMKPKALAKLKQYPDRFAWMKSRVVAPAWVQSSVSTTGAWSLGRSFLRVHRVLALCTAPFASARGTGADRH